MSITDQPENSVAQTGRRRPKWLVPAIIGAAAVIGAGVAIPITIGALASQGFTASGTMVLNGASSFTVAGAGCAGKGGYSDLGPGADVNVYDDAGKLVGNSKLGAGSPRQGACLFSFSVPSIPSGSKLYQIEISHRGKLTESEQQLTAGIELSIGS